MMRTKLKIVVVLVSIAAVSLLVFSVYGAVAMGEIGTSKIVGKAYIDTNGNRALDYSDIPANGLKLTLQKTERKMVEETSTLTTTMIDQVTVDENGEYCFKIAREGEYWIAIVYQLGVYELPYDAHDFFGNNPFKIQKGGITIGPTILLVKGGMG